jgi:hypothetical protein
VYGCGWVCVRVRVDVDRVGGSCKVGPIIIRPSTSTIVHHKAKKKSYRSVTRIPDRDKTKRLIPRGKRGGDEQRTRLSLTEKPHPPTTRKKKHPRTSYQPSHFPLNQPTLFESTRSFPLKKGNRRTAEILTELTSFKSSAELAFTSIEYALRMFLTSAAWTETWERGRWLRYG